MNCYRSMYCAWFFYTGMHMISDPRVISSYIVCCGSRATLVRRMWEVTLCGGMRHQGVDVAPNAGSSGHTANITPSAVVAASITPESGVVDTKMTLPFITREEMHQSKIRDRSRPNFCPVDSTESKFLLQTESCDLQPRLHQTHRHRTRVLRRDLPLSSGA